MKWPNTLTIVRHGESAYNEAKAAREHNPDYQKFLVSYENRRTDPETARAIAQRLFESGSLVTGTGDYGTPLTDKGKRQSEATGRALSKRIDVPDIIFVSPYRRTSETLDYMSIGWPALSDVKTVEEERIREQEHGLQVVYGDWRVFNVMHPDQERLYALDGEYWYRFPQGESVPDVRERLRSMQTTITRDYSTKNLLLVSHHLTLLGWRANNERLDSHGFQYLNEHERPINCGVTIYRGDPNQGDDGHLNLDIYNQQLYPADLAA